MRPSPRRCLSFPGRRVADQIGKQFLVTGARQEVGQLTRSHSPKRREFFILAVFEAMQDERRAAPCGACRWRVPACRAVP
jgi:hypothetical protein